MLCSAVVPQCGPGLGWELRQPHAWHRSTLVPGLSSQGLVCCIIRPAATIHAQSLCALLRRAAQCPEPWGCCGQGAGDHLSSSRSPAALVRGRAARCQCCCSGGAPRAAENPGAFLAALPGLAHGLRISWASSCRAPSHRHRSGIPKRSLPHPPGPDPSTMCCASTMCRSLPFPDRPMEDRQTCGQLLSLSGASSAPAALCFQHPSGRVQGDPGAWVPPAQSDGRSWYGAKGMRCSALGSWRGCQAKTQRGCLRFSKGK